VCRTGVKQLTGAAIEPSLYPNPASGQLTISLDEHMYRSFSIVNTLGQLMQHAEVTGSLMQVDVSSYAPAMYYIVFSGEQGSVVKKFVKE
jgi:hypothetical protein